MLRAATLGVVPRTRLISTSAGAVEIMHLQGERPPVLFFPGGHCSATADCGWRLYTEVGHGVVSFSRPGYGGTQVGPLSAAEFSPLVREVCEQLGISSVAAAVGVSFGGLQAVRVAADQQLGVPRLVLHSCAPSGLPYPDRRAEAILGPVLFSPPVQDLVWRVIRRLIRSDPGLRLMMGNLSTLPVGDWWGDLGAGDKREARALFESMRSDSGFVNDLRQGRACDVGTRRNAISRVRCPTLVTASPHDGGVSFEHALDFANTLADATLVELDAPSHLFWIGHQRSQLVSIIGSFLDG